MQLVIVLLNEKDVELPDRKKRTETRVNLLRHGNKNNSLKIDKCTTAIPIERAVMINVVIIKMPIVEG